MSKPINTNPLLLTSNVKRLEALCDGIENNCDSSIGWEQLTKQSGFTHNELMSLFEFCKRTTPMTYIRKVRKNKNSSNAISPQSQLFDGNNPSKNDE